MNRTGYTEKWLDVEYSRMLQDGHLVNGDRH